MKNKLLIIHHSLTTSPNLSFPRAVVPSWFRGVLVSYHRFLAPSHHRSLVHSFLRAFAPSFFRQCPAHTKNSCIQQLHPGAFNIWDTVTRIIQMITDCKNPSSCGWNRKRLYRIKWLSFSWLVGFVETPWMVTLLQAPNCRTRMCLER